MTALNLDHIRAEFPALAGGFVFLDNAGGSQVLARVADRVRDYLLTTSVQLGASYGHSQLAGERVLQARRAMAELINAPDDEEVVIGPATTAMMLRLTLALRSQIAPGDEIIVTNTDHEANVGCWTRLADAGAVIKVWPINRDSLRLELEDLQALLSPRTKWVAMTLASNVLGTVNPVQDVVRLAHGAGARVCVDAVAYAPHRLVDVQALGVDVLVLSLYKVFGPHQAVLWGRRELLASLTNLNHYFIGMDEVPYKLQPGSVNYELSYGCLGINDYLCAVGTRLGKDLGNSGTPRQLMQAAFDAFAEHEDALAERLLAWLRGVKGVRIIGLPTAAGGHRVPTISFVVEGRRSEDIVTRMDAHGIGIRFGDFYARRLIEALDLGPYGGVVRVSIAHYNTMAEIERLVARLSEIIG